MKIKIIIISGCIQNFSDINVKHNFQNINPLSAGISMKIDYAGALRSLRHHSICGKSLRTVLARVC